MWKESYMKKLLYGIVEMIADIHSHLLRLNDAYEYSFTDIINKFKSIESLSLA